MSTTTPVITENTARHVLWTFGSEGGYRPGSFTEKLLELLAHADPVNTARLALSFPAEAEAVRIAKYEKDGAEQLQKIAGVA